MMYVYRDPHSVAYCAISRSQHVLNEYNSPKEEEEKLSSFPNFHIYVSIANIHSFTCFFPGGRDGIRNSASLQIKK